MKDLKKLIREIPDFPKKGILFKDITPLLEDAEAFSIAVDTLMDNCPEAADKIAAIESRGFIFGSSLAYAYGAGFVPIRKAGKLPGETVGVTYDSEYGTDTLEVHNDGIRKGESVVLVDDLLATGGTAKASCQLIERCGGRVVKVLFLIELTDLGGMKNLAGYDVFSLLKL